MIKIHPALYRGIISGVVQKNNALASTPGAFKEQEKSVDIKMYKLLTESQKASGNQLKSNKKFRN